MGGGILAVKSDLQHVIFCCPLEIYGTMTSIVLGFFGLLKGIAWPLVVFGLAAIYKPEILSNIPGLRRILLRKMRVSIAGIAEAEFDATEQLSVATELRRISSDPSKIELKEIPGLTRTAAIATVERDLHAKLPLLTVDPVDVLIRNLAQARLEAAFGYIYVGIYGSQLNGLIALQARRRVPTSEAYLFYREVEIKYPEHFGERGFSGWLEFLKFHRLVRHDGDDLVITEFGDDFIMWLKAKKLTTSKPW
jgi:hypothetical protein